MGKLQRGDAILYQYWRSSASWRVRWALAIKGVAFQTIAINILSGEQNEESHRARNPVGHVPALFINGHTLTESVAIIEYLEETVPEPALYPKTSLERARVRQLVELVNSAIQPLQNIIVMKRVSQDSAAQRDFARHFNERGIEALNGLIKQLDEERGAVPTFCVSETLSAADLFVVPQLATARRFGVDLNAYPRLLAIESAALGTPHAAGALPENQSDAPSPVG